MQRHSIAPRSNWQSKLERLGFDYHSMDGSYWQEDSCYRFDSSEIDLIEDASNELHQMCLDTIDFIISQDRFSQLGIQPTTARWIEDSWRQAQPSLYGRFDLVYHPNHCPTPKLLEYNGDTPTSVFEASVVQWYWMQDNFPDADQFNSIHERLIAQWKVINDTINNPHLISNTSSSSNANKSTSNDAPKKPSLWQTLKELNDPKKDLKDIQGLGKHRPTKQSTITFATITDSIEDTITCRYLQDTATQAGFDTSLMDLRALGWLSEEGTMFSGNSYGQFVDDNNVPIDLLFKLYPWEWLLTEDFAKHIPNSPVNWVEPMWKLLLSNKGLLPILWEKFPNHPNLLPSYFESQRQRLSRHDLPHGIIKKPLFSREGANISALDRHFTPTQLATQGEYGGKDGGGFVYQAMQPLPKFIKNNGKATYAVIGSWMIGGVSAGMGIREDESLITKDSSHFVPHYFYPD